MQNNLLIPASKWNGGCVYLKLISTTFRLYRDRTWIAIVNFLFKGLRRDVVAWFVDIGEIESNN